MRRNPDYFKRYGNAQADADTGRRGCPGCGKRFRTTYEDILIRPLCAGCSRTGPRVEGLEGGRLP